MSWMLNPYFLIGAMLYSAALFLSGVYVDSRFNQANVEADRANLVDAYNKQLQDEFKRNNELSAALSAAEGRIVVKTVEVIKHVPTVTAGKPCLSPAAVGLLQPAAETLPAVETSGGAAAEGADASASDTDVAYWIAGANQQYETCAERLNTLIDYESK